jgi:hypothetical protein
LHRRRGHPGEDRCFIDKWINHLDAATSGPAQMKSKTTIVSDDEHLYEGFKKADEGWQKTMEITYKRKK